MSKSVKFSEAVAGVLNTVAPERFRAEVNLFPDFRFEKIRELKVIVCPNILKQKNLDRVSSEYLVKVNIGVMKRLADVSGELPELIDLVENIGKKLERKKLDGGTVISTDYEPIYDSAAIARYNCFFSICSATVKVIE